MSLLACAVASTLIAETAPLYSIVDVSSATSAVAACEFATETKVLVWLVQRQQPDGCFGTVGPKQATLTCLSIMALRLWSGITPSETTQTVARAKEWLRRKLRNAALGSSGLSDEERLVLAWQAFDTCVSYCCHDVDQESITALQLILDLNSVQLRSGQTVQSEPSALLDEAGLLGLDLIVTDMAKYLFPQRDDLRNHQRRVLRSIAEKYGVRLEIESAMDDWATRVALCPYLLLPQKAGIRFSAYLEYGGTTEWPVSGENYPLLRAFLERTMRLQSVTGTTAVWGSDHRRVTFVKQMKNATEMALSGVWPAQRLEMDESRLRPEEDQLYHAALYLLLTCPVRVLPKYR